MINWFSQEPWPFRLEEPMPQRYYPREAVSFYSCSEYLVVDHKFTSNLSKRNGEQDFLYINHLAYTKCQSLRGYKNGIWYWISFWTELSYCFPVIMLFLPESNTILSLLFSDALRHFYNLFEKTYEVSPRMLPSYASYYMAFSNHTQCDSAYAIL